mmetsp:Transcript_117971/g.333681  ORF Transcript_117971/g.333681 Transcript_117971/m.333681 type:complete len:338 (-) Transcript_117971:179-1192(-)
MSCKARLRYTSAPTALAHAWNGQSVASPFGARRLPSAAAHRGRSYHLVGQAAGARCGAVAAPAVLHLAIATPCPSSLRELLSFWAIIAGAGAALCCHRSQDRCAAGPSCCADSGNDDNGGKRLPGFAVCLGVGGALAAVTVRQLWTTRTGAAVASSVAVPEDQPAHDRIDVVLDQMRSYFAARPDAAKSYMNLVTASGSTSKRGIDLQRLADEHQQARAFLEIVDTDEVGMVPLPEFMALAAASSLMNSSRPGKPAPDFNSIVFEFFCAVDDDFDGQITESQWRGLHKVLAQVMHLFGLLPPHAATGIAAGTVDLTTFRSCCKSHLDESKLVRRHRA